MRPPSPTGSPPSLKQQRRPGERRNVQGGDQGGQCGLEHVAHGHGSPRAESGSSAISVSLHGRPHAKPGSSGGARSKGSISQRSGRVSIPLVPPSPRRVAVVLRCCCGGCCGGCCGVAPVWWRMNCFLDSGILTTPPPR